jgi:HSP20 family molecular chaperone IbpA
MFSDELLIPGLMPWSLFDNSLTFPMPSMSPWTLLDDCSSRFPIMTNIKEDTLFIEVEVPRFKPDELNVDVNPKTGVIRISGNRGKGKPSFQHRLLVSPKVYDVENHTSALQDGVFTVSIPRRKVIAAKPQEKPDAENPATGEVQKAPQAEVATPSEEWPPRLLRKTEGTTTTYSCRLPAQVKPEDVQISVLEHGALRLRLTLSNEEKTAQSSYRRDAVWETQFPLPKDVTAKGVKAELKDGQLMIVAQPEPHQPNSIPVQIQ